MYCCSHLARTKVSQLALVTLDRKDVKASVREGRGIRVGDSAVGWIEHNDGGLGLAGFRSNRNGGRR